MAQGLPANNQVWFQKAATPVMEGIIDVQLEMSFHFIYILTLVIYGLIGSIILYSEESNPLPSKASHWTNLERIYSVIPMLIVVCLYAPAFSLIYSMDEYPDTFASVKAVGRQWYWHYEVTVDGEQHYPNIQKFVLATLNSNKLNEPGGVLSDLLLKVRGNNKFDNSLLLTKKSGSVVEDLPLLTKIDTTNAKILSDLLLKNNKFDNSLLLTKKSGSVVEDLPLLTKIDTTNAKILSDLLLKNNKKSLDRW